MILSGVVWLMLSLVSNNAAPLILTFNLRNTFTGEMFMRIVFITATSDQETKQWPADRSGSQKMPVQMWICLKVKFINIIISSLMH